MDTIDFSKSIPPEQLASIFKDYFEQHMAAYFIAKGMGCGTVQTVDMDKASIIYNIHILSDTDKEKIKQYLESQSLKLYIYGKTLDPKAYINGDLLCITIKK